MPLPKELIPIKKSVSQEQVIAYSEASGDYNPIHIDEHFAATTPFGKTIAHGMLILSFVSEMMSTNFGEIWLHTGTIKVRFKAPVYVGDTVYVFGSLDQGEPKINYKYPSYSVGCQSEDGTLCVVGKATVGLVF